MRYVSEKNMSHCEGKLESDHNYRFKQLVVQLVDEDGFGDDVKLIVSVENQKRREVDLVEKSVTNFVDMDF